MVDAVAPFADERFLTPMAAVAGAVAEEVLTAMTSAAPLARAYVNNGGDIALYLSDGRVGVPSPLVGEGKGGGASRLGRGAAIDPAYALRSPKRVEGGPAPSFDIGLIARPDQPAPFGKARISAQDHERGVATSGWRGRSFSLGIADAVTVIARTAAIADAAATLIANAVDLPGHPAITRAPAFARDPQSDLGGRLVTLDVGALSAENKSSALDRGAREAEHWRSRGLISAAALRLGPRTRLVGAAPSLYALSDPAPATEPLHAVG
jgi:ApbE superfamily uncharacterized protein (UPF0280 family)